MIIQKVVKGLILGDDPTRPPGDVAEEADLRRLANITLEGGIVCRWAAKYGYVPMSEVPHRLTARNLYWHQNKYDDPDPLRGGQPFSEETPFISTSAGSIVRDDFWQRNVLEAAKWSALWFATSGWVRSGLVVYAYLFILGKKAVGHEQFSEEIRELNIYTGYSPFQPEGEITAKIHIPTTQIERIELWMARDYQQAINRGYFDIDRPTDSISNPLYLPPTDYHNIREML